MQENVVKFKNRTKKKKIKKVILITGICFAVSIPIIIVLLIVLMVWVFVNSTSDGTDMPMAMQLDMDECSSQDYLTYFDSTGEAIAYWIGEDYDKYRKEKDILTLEDDNAITKFSLYESESEEWMYVNTFEMKEDEYSEPVCSRVFDVKNMIAEVVLIKKIELTFKEQIALDLLFSSSSNQTSYANDGVLVPYGLTDSDEIYDLTIMGESPTKIIPIDYAGTTFYFWCFDSEMLDEALREKGNGSYTCGEFVDMMEIEVSDN